MDTAFDNSNGATLDNLNQDIFQKSSVLTDGDLDMDIKNTNITSPSIDTLNNIQSYTIDNQKSSDLIDENRISDDYRIVENNQHSQVHNIAPLNGKASEFNASDNYFGPESNVDDDTTTGSPLTEELNERNDEIENSVNTVRPDELVVSHGIHFENIDYLKTVDEVEECDNKKDDVDVADHHERNFDNEEFENKIFSTDTPSGDLVAESIKLVDAVLPEKIEDPIEDPIQPENVIVPESGEESEDEWNYIKVNQDTNEHETQERNIISQETVESHNLCPDLVNDNNQTEDYEIVGIEESSLSEADMASQLNPDAKEFVPTSPSPTNTTPINSSLDINGIASTMATLRLNLDDDLVSQSPRKGTESAMVDVSVPEENDFLNDITQRPADLDSTVMSDPRPGSSSSQCSYQEMNLKEAMHGDEKQEYAPDVLNTPDQVVCEANSTNGDHEEFISILNKSMRNQDVMNASFYNDGTSDSNNPFKVDLNAVHRLPTSDDENEDERVEAPTGTTYSFEDTEFGMNDFIQMDNSEVNGSTEVENGVSVSEPRSNETDSIVELVQEMISENMAVLNECNLSSTDAVLTETAENVSSTTTDNIIDFVGSGGEPVAVDLVSVETENFTSPTAVLEPVVSNLIPEQQCLVPEQQPEPNIVVENGSIVDQNIISNDVVAATENEPIVEAVAIAAVASVATAAVALATTKTKPAEPKSKTVPVKKPLSAGLTAKPKSKPDAAITKTAPIPRPRTAASQPPAKTTIEKKPSSTLAAKKPVNGEVKPTVSASKRPVSSTTTLKSTTSARTGASATTATTSTTTTRVTATRLSAKTSTTGADAPKRVATTKTSTTTTSSSTLKPRPASASTITRSPISKANTSAADKSAKETVNKLQTSGARAPVSPRTTTSTSRTAGTLPLKKAEAAKVPSAPAPTKRPISSTQRAPVLTSTTTNTKVAPTTRRPISASTNLATTLETVKKTTSTLKKDTKSPANATKEAKPKENGNGTATNGTHAFDAPINDAVNVGQEPVIM